MGYIIDEVINTITDIIKDLEILKESLINNKSMVKSLDISIKILEKSIAILKLSNELKLKKIGFLTFRKKIHNIENKD